MSYNSLFIAGMFIIGLSLVIFARPIAIWDYKIDSRWKITLGLGVDFRIWFFRIAGIIMICMASFVLAYSWASQFN